MYIALGALGAGLLALMIAPAIWNRAVHLTRRRIEATVPLEVEEIRAEKDLMRADFALALRRMEKKLEAEKQTAAERRVEIARQAETLHAANTDRDAKADAVFELEERERVLRSELRSREEELVRTAAHLREAERKLVARNNEIAILKGSAPRPESSFAFLETSADGDDIDATLEELDAKSLRREVKASKREFDAAQVRISTLSSELDSTRAALEAAKKTIAELREQSEDGEAFSRINAYAHSESAELKQMETRILELEAHRVQSEAEITRLTVALENAGASGGDGGDSPRDAARRNLQAANEALRAEVATLVAERDRLRGDVARLTGEPSEFPGGPLTPPALQAVPSVDADDNGEAALRDKISELTADIASLTATGETGDTRLGKMIGSDEGGDDETTLFSRIRRKTKSRNNGRKLP